MVEMVTPRNDTIELSVVKEKQRQPLPSAPPLEYINGNSLEREMERKRPAPRKRCWTVVTLTVVVLVAIGAGTIVFYEHLTGRLPVENDNGRGPLPESVTSGAQLVTDRAPILSDPYPEESSSIASTTLAEEVIYIDSTTEDAEGSISIDSREESVEDRPTSEQDYGDGYGSGDVSEPAESSEEKIVEEGSGSGSGDDSED